jgi:hypothetical protein
MTADPPQFVWAAFRGRVSAVARGFVSKLSAVGIWLLACVASVSSVNAQSTFGSVLGVVKDPGGLLVPGAKITLISLEEQSSRDTVSDGDGNFQFMNVKSGRYEITAQADGFAVFKLASIQLDARQTMRTDISLKVQSASETVEVGDAAPMINTESATLADTKDFLQVSQTAGTI